MTWLLMNIPLMIVFVALWAGIPLWLVLRRPDRKPALAAAPGVTRMPSRAREDAGRRRAA